MTRSRILAALAMVTVLAVGIVGLRIAPSSAESARVVAPPALDEPAGRAPTEVAVLAGGCFWGVQGVFQHVDGVTSAVSGYAGGAKETAEYDKVGSGRTGHAESVRITYDPRKVSYGRLLQIYFSVAHDPTELNRQAFGAKIATTIEPGRTFYPAEAYHQDYLTLHPNQPYIAINDLPKVANLKRLFADSYRAEPVLVGKTGM